MPILRKALEFTRQAPTDRLPTVGGVTGLLPRVSTGTTSQLNSMTSAGWLFAVVDAIATAVSASQWTLFRVNRNGEREEVDGHPAMELWRNANPFHTGEEFREISAQHFDLAGEMWWVVVRGENGLEMWPLRPDRMAVKPSGKNFVESYVYQVGEQRFPLDPKQVILTRRPHPQNPYRGIAPIASIMDDLASERESAQWTQSFFRNGATPGGVLKVPENLDDEEFEKLQQRWRTSHQGVGNAWRVAILEGGMEWKDVGRISQREMQFEQLRRLNRDIILGAYRVHPSLVGVSEDVNRANAEAAEVTFARWVVRPRLQRIRAALNERLLPLFPDGETLEFDFIDPTPEDRKFTLEQAATLFEKQIATKNEARELAGLDPLEEGGDQFFFPLASTPEPVQKGAKQRDPLSPLEEAEAEMRANWEARLEQEVEALVGVLEAREKAWTKFGPSDIEAHDWNWWEKYGGAVTAELLRVFDLSFNEEFPNAPPAAVQRLAAGYAEARGAALLKVDGSANLANQTRERVRALVARSVESGESLGTLTKNLRGDLAFSRSRAEMVARTETATALGQGQKQAARNQGRDQKRWMTQGDDRVEPDCLANEGAGWIEIDQPFPAGVDTVPQHPRCRCTVIYRTKALAEGRHNGHVAEARCPDCNKLLGKNVVGADLWCDRCKKEVGINT